MQTISGEKFTQNSFDKARSFLINKFGQAACVVGHHKWAISEQSNYLLLKDAQYTSFLYGNDLPPAQKLTMAVKSRSKKDRDYMALTVEYAALGFRKCIRKACNESEFVFKQSHHLEVFSKNYGIDVENTIDELSPLTQVVAYLFGDFAKARWKLLSEEAERALHGSLKINNDVSLKTNFLRLPALDFQTIKRMREAGSVNIEFSSEWPDLIN